MTVWREIDGWIYEYFDRNIAPGALPGFEDLVELWRGKCGDRPVPVKADFDFHDFNGWHGRIIMSDVTYDPFDFHYRLVGVQVVERMQVDLTGKSYSQLVREGLEPKSDFEFYEMTSREMLITRVSGEFRWLDRTHVSATFVEFPLSDNSEVATHLLAAMM